MSSLNVEDKDYKKSDYPRIKSKRVESQLFENKISLFRAVGESEFYSVMRTKRFSFWHRSAKVKYFANDF